jgi:hypothetical protein
MEEVTPAINNKLRTFKHISYLSKEELAEEISKSKFSYLSEIFLELEICGRMLNEIEDEDELFESMESWSDRLFDNDSKNELLNEFNYINRNLRNEKITKERQINNSIEEVVLAINNISHPLI